MKKAVTALLIAVAVGACREDESTPFYPVELILPEAAAAQQSPEAVLTWGSRNFGNEQAYETRYDVYLGTSPSALALVKADVREPYYRCEALALNTEYYWKIRIKSGEAFRDSEVSTFTTTDELPLVALQDAKIMVYPADYVKEDARVFLITLRNAGAYSWTDGSANTKALLKYYERGDEEALAEALNYCNDLQAYGFSDWYLPAIVELDSVVSKFDLLERTNDEYWSSTEYQKRPHMVYTKSGLTYPNEPYSIEQKGGSGSTFRCRCARRE